MPHISVMFPSKYIKGADIVARKSKQVTLTITAVKQDLVRMRDNTKEKRWIVSLKETQKQWICNQTNAWLIAEVFGTEYEYSEKWPGLRLILTTEKVHAFGKWHDAIRVKKERPGAPRKSRPEPPSEPEGDEADDAEAFFSERESA